MNVVKSYTVRDRGLIVNVIKQEHHRMRERTLATTMDDHHHRALPIVDSSVRAMTLSIKLPDGYGYVLLTSAVGSLVTHTYLAVQVMKARDDFCVEYPNLYATPAYHKKADEFNRVQRGHQNFCENLPIFLVLSLAGGLKHPLVASVASVLHSAGSVLYMKGYADTALDVKTARYKKGGPIKQLGLIAALGSTVSLIGSLSGWW
jgi:glutathione S-transferase